MNHKYAYRVSVKYDYTLHAAGLQDNTIFINYNNFIEIKRKTEEAN